MSKHFGGLKAVDQVSFDVSEGEILGIAGPNGSGKSTLFNIMTKVPFAPTTGNVALAGQPLDRLTPHAIATVRGTQFAVDVDAGVTSVFVVEGSVEVSRRDGPATVLLGPGEGVDVRPGEPLVVREWPQPRVNALLARFGR